MAKTVIKQIIITLLLCLVIMLILAVLLYAYIPNNKVIPESVSYTAPEEAQEVLKEAAVDETQVIMTYEIKASDLTNAEKTNEYNPGKVNPFSSYVVEEDETTSTNGSTNSTNGSTSTNGTTSGSTDSSENNTSGGSYFKDSGTK